MTDKLPPLPDLGWTCLCTKCGRTWEIDKPQKSADCQCGYAAFVVQNKRPTVEQMQEYARQAVREAVPDGFVLVPVEPTEDMEVAMIEASLLGRSSPDDPAYVRSIYKSMIASQEAK